MSEASDIASAGLVVDEAAGKVRSAAHSVADAGRQLAHNTESLQQERQRWQDEVLPELRAVSAEILAGFAELAEIRRKAGAVAVEPGLGIALAQAEERTVASGAEGEAPAEKPATRIYKAMHAMLGVCIARNTALTAERDRLAHELANLTIERDAALAECNRARRGLAEVESLIRSSRGVCGLHLNGDDAPWEELRGDGRFPWLTDFDTALVDADGKPTDAVPSGDGLRDEVREAEAERDRLAAQLREREAATLEWAVDYLDGWQQKADATPAYLAAYDEALTRLRAAADRVRRGEPAASRSPLCAPAAPAPDLAALERQNNREAVDGLLHAVGEDESASEDYRAALLDVIALLSDPEPAPAGERGQRR